MKTTILTKSFPIILTASSLLAIGCGAGPSTEVGASDQHIEAADVGVQPIAGSAMVTLGLVQLRADVIVSEVAEAGPEDIKPGFELELFAPTTLAPVAGLHGAEGLTLREREMAVVNFAPLAAIAQRAGGRQDAALYLQSALDPSGLYSLPTAQEASVPYTGKPGIAVTEEVCDFGKLTPEDQTPYPGLMAASALADGKVHGAVVSMNAPGTVKIRLVAQVEHCAKAVTTAADAKAEPRLCYEKLVWLKANGGSSTELGRLSAYRAPLSHAQTSYCGD